jgi:hypothetical protein
MKIRHRLDRHNEERIDERELPPGRRGVRNEHDAPPPLKLERLFVHMDQEFEVLALPTLHLSTFDAASNLARDRSDRASVGIDALEHARLELRDPFCELANVREQSLAVALESVDRTWVAARHGLRVGVLDRLR